ncbi:MAG: UDP-N-acetylmuramoyl-L-alanyl-D-glutamate--2,6-diaminopimelate ligase [Deltaproteobacteria bacterium]|nr:UDP-N-acetylmuramoyl-L-alanyl-D-glutamate--2,6-diaminopimelate ligase [Deltaproteobacteria bacterium]
MVLQTLIKSLDARVAGDSDIEVSGIAYDSRSVRPGFIFAAIPGEHVDGHSFIGRAVEAGASCVLAERETENTAATQVIVKDIRAALSKVSALFYGEPSKRLTLVGVTGTNGKTTTTYLLESIFKAANLNPGVIGTVNYRYNGATFEAPHTTPQAPDLQRLLKDMADAGVTHAIMEASSHALEQKRAGDCAFKVGIFTNLTLDHLDYHKTMDEYFNAKAILFGLVKDNSGRTVVNIDDAWGVKLKEMYPASITVSLEKGADVYPSKYALKDGMTEAVVRTPSGDVNISSHLVGEYNLQNILTAVAASYALGIEGAKISGGISSLARVPGRLEKIEALGARPFRAYVDYAHTSDALERALNALRPVSTGRIITVFGCGGNRDRTKRPKMGGIAARLSDVTIITSDNPRDEDPIEIIKEIEAGIEGTARKKADEPLAGHCYTVIPDRTEAIWKAVSEASAGDTILVAGKGHEDYQIVKGKKSRFSDFEVLRSAIDGSGKAGRLRSNGH